MAPVRTYYEHIWMQHIGSSSLSTGSADSKLVRRRRRVRTALPLHGVALALGLEAVLRRDVDAPVRVLEEHLAYLRRRLSEKDGLKFAAKEFQKFKRQCYVWL